ncbi:hypothetical protein EHN06_01830 [Marinobacter sp. NP-4(2019)]|uniref:hypothetical protein n=1 Tax=Marinobacter sp. NP-4(2019) TaxID=2488665 RepID=UPI000FC3D7DA|nr:hypothetical protein [Marinobacter sp. NP-4(2019)]AZT82377.1 hypothetical protein EHN06_01830 [Marinobacter sp. NP-4(2019)]
MVNIKKTSLLAVVAGSTALAGCLDSGGQTSKNADPIYEIDNPNHPSDGTKPIFRPLDTAFPLPSDPLFFLNPENDGTMLNGTDPANPVTTGLGFVDGNSILAPFDVKISGSLDPNQTLDARAFVEIDGEVVPNPDQNVFLLEIEYPTGDSIFQQQREVGGVVDAEKYRHAKRLEEQGDTAAADALYQELLEQRVRIEIITVDANGPAGAAGGSANNAIRILPVKPLKPKTKYAVVLSNDIVDKDGEPLVQELRFETASNPEFVLSNPALQPFRDSMLPARAFGSDFFDFKRETLSELGRSAAGIPTFDDVTFAISFTTTAVEDVLLANAAPAAWFRNHLLTDRKQSVLNALIDGDFNLSDQPLSGASAEDQQINSRIFELLTDDSYRLFDAELANILTEANEGGMAVLYGDLVASEDDDRRLAFILQDTATQAVEDVVDVSAQADQLAANASDILDTPKPRDTRFFSQKEGGEVNPALEQTAADLGITEVNVNIQVYEGEITLPYFQSTPEGTDGTPLQTDSWQVADLSDGDSLPTAASDRITYRFPFAGKNADTKVPIVVTAPDADFSGTGPFPVIIYQHAATTDRSAILPMGTAAGLLCIADGSYDCFVTIGIDQPLHGIFDEGIVSARDEENGVPGMIPITEQAGASADATERHFGFALNASRQAVTADQVEAPASGDLFLNFTNYANTRDNMRQGTLDLLNLNASLQAIEDAINACNTAGDCANGIDFDTSRVYFLSHSLSGMGGVPFPVVNNLASASNTNLTPITASNIFNSGGQFTRLVENSQNVAPQLLPVLDAASGGLLAQGRTELNIYFNVFQALLDSADPTAFAPMLEGTSTLLTSIVGVPGDPDRPTDNTIPNAADDELYALGPLETVIPETGFEINSEPAPLAGTDPVAAAMGAVSTPLAGGGSPAITRYLEGAHGNPISAGQKDAEAFSSSAVFDEMANQMLRLFTDGTTEVFNPCVVQDADTTGVDCEAQSDAGSGDDGSGGGDDGGDDGDDGGLIGDLL